MRTIWIGLLLVCGCGGGSSAMGNQVTGTVDGITVTALGAIFARDSYDDAGVHHELAHVLIGESASLCSIARGSYVGAKNSHVVTLDFEAADNSTSIVGPGNYPNWQPTSGSSSRSGANVVAGLVSVGTTCDWNTSGGPGALASTGSVDLAASDAGAMTGTFDFTFGAKGSASGSFEAVACPDWLGSATKPPCQ